VSSMFETLVALAASTMRVSLPLIFAALGGLMSERAGVINIALEGGMLLGAFVAAAVTLTTGSPLLGLAAAVAAGSIYGAIYAFFSIEARSNQIVAGTAMNMLAIGLTPLLCKALYGSGGSSPSIPIENRLGMEVILFAGLLILAIHFWFYRSASGLWLRFAGEHPQALSAAGVRVRAVRWSAVILSGALAALGGAVLSIALSSSFSRGMSAGRGFIALAALIFGKWKPIPTAFACLLFGLMDAGQIRLQGLVLWGSEPVPVQFIQILPYIFTVLVLAGFVGKSRPPQALGGSL
jgi:ABC-type uncharacterized transport system permease subunit